MESSPAPTVNVVSPTRFFLHIRPAGVCRQTISMRLRLERMCPMSDQFDPSATRDSGTVDAAARACPARPEPDRREQSRGESRAVESRAVDRNAVAPPPGPLTTHSPLLSGGNAPGAAPVDGVADAVPPGAARESGTVDSRAVDDAPADDPESNPKSKTENPARNPPPVSPFPTSVPPPTSAPTNYPPLPAKSSIPSVPQPRW
jgi:hypothetical protein